MTLVVVLVSWAEIVPVPATPDTGCSPSCACSQWGEGMRALGSCQPTLGSNQWPGEFLCRHAQKPELTAACSWWDYSAALKMKEQMVLMGERGPEVQDGIVTMLITRLQIPQCFLLAWKMRVPSLWPTKVWQHRPREAADTSFVLLVLRCSHWSVWVWALWPPPHCPCPGKPSRM